MMWTALYTLPSSIWECAAHILFNVSIYILWQSLQPMKQDGVTALQLLQ